MQDDDRYLAFRASLVAFVRGIHLDEPRPEPALLLPLDLFGPDTQLPAADLDGRLGVGLQVEPPDRITIGATVRGDRGVVDAVLEIEERSRALPPRLAAGGEEPFSP